MSPVQVTPFLICNSKFTSIPFIKMKLYSMLTTPTTLALRRTFSRQRHSEICGRHSFTTMISSRNYSIISILLCSFLVIRLKLIYRKWCRCKSDLVEQGCTAARTPWLGKDISMQGPGSGIQSKIKH
jgi:hypothetical protein